MVEGCWGFFPEASLFNLVIEYSSSTGWHPGDTSKRDAVRRKSDWVPVFSYRHSSLGREYYSWLGQSSNRSTGMTRGQSSK